jgi:hypothetical protein
MRFLLSYGSTQCVRRLAKKQDDAHTDDDGDDGATVITWSH